jgi:hypothetical protein
MASSNEWNIECRYGNYATYAGPMSGYHREVEVDGTYLREPEPFLGVRAEVGSGYMRESTDCNIPVFVLLTLLRNAGYIITEPALPEVQTPPTE